MQTALDATNLTWATSGTGGAAGWFPETNVTHDGVSAAESEYGFPGKESSVLQSTVTGPGTLTFWCYTPDPVDGELIFSVSNLTEAIFSQMNSWQQQSLRPSWQQAVFYIGSGPQTLTWTYTNSEGYETEQPAYLDQVSWVTGTTAPIITNQPLSQSQVPGMNTTFSVGAGGTPPLSYQWCFNSNAIAGATSDSYTVSNVQAANLGYYSVTITNIAGSNYANASLEFGNVTGWGDNTFFQTSISPGTTNVIGISAGAEQNLALKADGTLLAWGQNNYGQQYTIPSNLSNVVAVAENSFNSMAITAGGSLIEWGDNSFGQTNVAKTLTNVVAAASGIAFDTIILKSLPKQFGNVVAGGPNSGEETNVPIDFRTNVVAIAGGVGTLMALESDGTITLWGNGALPPGGVSKAVAIAIGEIDCVALEPNGTVESWSISGEATNVPPGLSNVVAIAAGWEHFVALKADGTVVAWGDNTFGQTNVPAGLSNVVAISAGENHTIALVGNGPPITSAPIQNPTLSSNGFSFSIPSQSGRVYALEYKNNITNSAWTALPLVAGNGTNLTMTDHTATNAQRFYRVQRW